MTPVLYILGCLFLVFHLTWENPTQALFGFLILSTGIPVYFVFKKKFVKNHHLDEDHEHIHK